MRKEAVILAYNDIAIGSTYSFEKTIDKNEVLGFAALTGDTNPLHVDPDYAQQTKFGKNVVHGMLLGSLFSTLVGMYCPGKNNLYVSQTLFFRSPVYYGDTVIVTGEILDKTDSTKLITIKTTIVCNNNVVVDGEAKVIVSE